MVTTAPDDRPTGLVVATHAGPTSPMAKPTRSSIRLVAGRGVEGDRHHGATIQHGPAAAADPTRPNDRQVHLVPVEVLEGLQAGGFAVEPGSLGENVTTRGVDLLALPLGTRLALGEAELELTGLRHPGPPEAPVDAPARRLDADGIPVGKVGVFAVVRTGGAVRPGDTVRVSRPAGPAEPLRPI